MQKYRCKNGEIVFVEESKSNPELIYVHYKEKRYERSKYIIGKTIFPEIDTRCKVNYNTVVELEDVETKEKLCLFVYEPETKLEYRRMGGSYL